jgi:hypothetical protein
MKIVELTGTTSAGGDLTVTSAEAHLGFLVKVVNDWVDLAATADLTLTEEAEMSQTLLVKVNAAQADATWYPRITASNPADGAVSGFTNQERAMITGKLKLVVAQGGNAATARVLVYLDEVDA